MCAADARETSADLPLLMADLVAHSNIIQIVPFDDIHVVIDKGWIVYQTQINDTPQSVFDTCENKCATHVTFQF